MSNLRKSLRSFKYVNDSRNRIVVFIVFSTLKTTQMKERSIKRYFMTKTRFKFKLSFQKYVTESMFCMVSFLCKSCITTVVKWGFQRRKISKETVMNKGF